MMMTISAKVETNFSVKLNECSIAVGNVVSFNALDGVTVAMLFLPDHQ